MRYTLIFILLYSIPALLSAQPDKLNTDSALMCYKNGKYEEAIKIYEKIINTGYEAPAIYFNLGNCYYKSNKLCYAILNYERAKILAPNDEDINFNLELAQKHVIDKLDILPALFITNWLNRYILSKPSDTWAMISIFSFILFLIFFSGYLFLTILSFRKVSFGLSIFILLISITTFIFAYRQKTAIENHKSAIIFIPTVNIKSSPDEKGTDIFVLHEGTKVELRDEVGNWKEIRLSDGNTGWIKSSDIIVI
jgi:tetratricopeptide (TPR) repeat protein